MSMLPKVLIITGDVNSIFTDVWGVLLSSLRAISDVTLSSDPVSSRQLLLTGEICSVLVVSPQPYLSSEEPYRILRDSVRNFAERQGGTVLFCGTFSSFINVTTFNAYFGNEWKLPWRFGDYHRSTFTINPSFNSNGTNPMASSTFDPVTAGLDKSYSQKAVHVKGASENGMVYTVSSESVLESRVFAPAALSDKTQSPTVFQCYGKGHVGFLGDVNGEDGSTKAILAMCGLTRSTTPPVVVAGTEDTDVGGVYCSGCGKQARKKGETMGENYKRCSKCKVCHYCSSRCQKAHWQAGHKEDCKYMNDDDED